MISNTYFLCAQPATPYYRWQVETVIYNFRRMGIDDSQIIILLAVDYNIIPEDWRKLRAKYSRVKFHFYSDNRTSKDYIPAIYFHLVKKWIKQYPEYKDKRIFFHDSDIIFTSTPNLDFVVDSPTWYLSNTNSYINYDYIISKGEEQYEEMCRIVGIQNIVPKLFNNHSGGAQYIGYGMDYEFWDKVERDAITLYDYLTRNEPYYIKAYEGDYPIQRWTSGMWAFLWGIWLSGSPTEVRKELDFCWATDPISKIDECFILHNAGVVAEGHNLFFKGSWSTELPYGQALEPGTNRASWYYWKEVMDTGKQSVFNI